MSDTPYKAPATEQPKSQRPVISWATAGPIVLGLLVILLAVLNIRK